MPLSGDDSLPTLPLLLVADEIRCYRGEDAGSVEADRIDPIEGTLALVDRRSSGGATPARLNAPEAFHPALVAVSHGFAHQPSPCSAFSSASWGLRRRRSCSTSTISRR